MKLLEITLIRVIQSIKLRILSLIDLQNINKEVIIWKN